MATERDTAKRCCVSNACIACRKRKSKCDGNLPSCSACSSVYHTKCVFDPTSDHRRKGICKKDTGNSRTRSTTLQALFQVLTHYDEDDAFRLVRQIQACNDLGDVAKSVISQKKAPIPTADTAEQSSGDDVAAESNLFEFELAGRISELALYGSRKFIGGTSNLIFLPPSAKTRESASMPVSDFDGDAVNDAQLVTRWTKITDDDFLIGHLLKMYFTWHYPFFTVLAKSTFYRDYYRGVPSPYCSALLVNAMLALGCHFSSRSGALADAQNPATAGDHFFQEAKRLVLENDEHENAKLCTVQAFALMSVREAGCGREGKGWVYSGLSFRMAVDLGMNFEKTKRCPNLDPKNFDAKEIDARRITFWGCYNIDKCWSNYLGRQPQLSSSNINIPKFDVVLSGEQELWSAYTDSGVSHEQTQPSRTRTVALQISKLCEISCDILEFFYHPMDLENPETKDLELKRLNEIHGSLRAWRNSLPQELELREGQLPQVFVMHMLSQLLLIHLYRPFLKYTKANTPLPSDITPRKICTLAASAISELLRMYERAYGLKHICNIVIYIVHTACTIHLLDLPNESAPRDAIHGLRSLEEMSQKWPCAHRTLHILKVCASKWKVNLPLEAATIFQRTHMVRASWSSWDQATCSISDDALNSRDDTQPGATSSTYDPFGNLMSTTIQPAELATINSSVTGMGPSVSLQYPTSGASSITGMPSMQTSRMPRIVTQQIDLAQPEPSYLQPSSQAGCLMPDPGSAGVFAPSLHIRGWCELSEIPIPLPSVAYEPTQCVIGGLDPVNSVEDSRDWGFTEATPPEVPMGAIAGQLGPEKLHSCHQFHYDGSTCLPLSTTQQPRATVAASKLRQHAGLGVPT